MVCDAPFAGIDESLFAGRADRRAAAFVFVVGGDVTDSLVEPDRVVMLADDREFDTEHGRVFDEEQVGPLAFDVSEQRLDPCLIGRGAGPSKVLRDCTERHELACRS